MSSADPTPTPSTPPVTTHEAGDPDRGDGLGAPAPVERGGLRDRIRSKPGLAQAYRVGVFLAGLLFIAVGLALAVLPGPLTIPPVLVGLYIWSTEFAWAHRLFESFRRKGEAAWEHAKLHPVSSAVITIGGLVLAGVAFWAVGRYELIDKAMTVVGL